MNGLKRGAIGLLGTVLVVGAGASMWFWFTPVGVNNYVNKVTLQLAIDSPELLTYLGAIDNTPLDFTAANWPTTRKKKRNAALPNCAMRERVSMITDPMACQAKSYCCLLYTSDAADE